MSNAALRRPITPPDDHIVTTQEALEPLFLQLEAEVDRKLIKAAVAAGWKPGDVLQAIEELRKPEPSKDG